jgi:fermentation-respiration switch protein FrsA (DUF1100 family)
MRAPLLVIVTERDEIVPAELSRRVFDAAAEPKRYASINGLSAELRYVPLFASHHNDPALLAGDEMLAAVTSFLDEWLAGGSEDEPSGRASGARAAPGGSLYADPD